MRKMMLTGHIVSDAEKKIAKSGKEYITFRFANNDSVKKGENDKNSTYWFSVKYFKEGSDNFCKYLKKGKPVFITGDYDDNIYESKVSGGCEIGRNIIADSINFFDLGTKKQGDSDNESYSANNVSEQANYSNAPTKTQTKMETSKVKQEETVAASVSSDNDDDELPF